MKSAKKLIVFAFITLAATLLVGCSSSADNQTKTFTMSEVAQANSRTNCKLVINGKVYDVTTFITSHPGGDEILKGCGKDATSLFTGTDPNGRDHSSDAERTLQRYYVGDLAK